MKRDCSHKVAPGGGATPPTITSPTSPSAWQETMWMILEVRVGVRLAEFVRGRDQRLDPSPKAAGSGGQCPRASEVNRGPREAETLVEEDPDDANGGSVGEKLAVARDDHGKVGSAERDCVCQCSTLRSAAWTVTIPGITQPSSSATRGPAERAQIVERLMREVGPPMTPGEVVEAFNRRDIEILAKDKSRYLGTIAWRNKHAFINIDGRGYWLRDALAGVPGVPPNTTHFDPSEQTSDELPL